MKFLLVGVLLFAQAPQGSVERGKKLYQEKWCHTCHGTVGQGEARCRPGSRQSFPLRSVRDADAPPARQHAALPGRVLSDQMADIYAYVSSIKPGRRRISRYRADSDAEFGSAISYRG